MRSTGWQGLLPWKGRRPKCMWRVKERLMSFPVACHGLISECLSQQYRLISQGDCPQNEWQRWGRGEERSRRREGNTFIYLFHPSKQPPTVGCHLPIMRALLPVRCGFWAVKDLPFLTFFGFAQPWWQETPAAGQGCHGYGVTAVRKETVGPSDPFLFSPVCDWRETSLSLLFSFSVSQNKGTMLKEDLTELPFCLQACGHTLIHVSFCVFLSL